MLGASPAVISPTYILQHASQARTYDVMLESGQTTISVNWAGIFRTNEIFRGEYPKRTCGHRVLGTLEQFIFEEYYVQ